MSQSLRARIAALFHGGTNLLDRDVVLSMVADHEREQAAVAMGVQPVAQPSEKVGELPAWLRELDRLKVERSRKNLCLLTAHRLDLLEPLDTLRRVILSGNGETVIPEWFRTLLDIPPFERPPFDAKRIGYRSGGYPLGWIGSDRWRIIQPEERARILGAIDAAGNGLLP